MAILGSQPGVEVTIKSNGMELTEYEDGNDKADGPLAEKTIIRYIETIPEFSFSIHLAVRKGTQFHCDYLNFHCKVDGVNITNPLFHSENICEKGLSWDNSYLEAPDETEQICRKTYGFKQIETGE